MGKFITSFEDHNAYQQANFDYTNTPNVSLCKSENDIHYQDKIPFDPYNGYEYVDLGLPSGTKWAKMNVGASSETAYGNYYKYGSGSKLYSNDGIEYGGTDNPLLTSDDTAAQVMGGQWHMPTKEQIEELTANTTYEWTTINGINGGKFTAVNGNYVFFPAAGLYSNTNVINVGSTGYYRSSTPGSSGSSCRFDLTDNKCGIGFYSNGQGCSIRGVVG